MKTLLLTLMIVIGSMTIAPKKAEAGILTVAATGGSTIGFVFVGGGAVFASVGALKFILDTSVENFFSGVGYGVLAGVLFVLDSPEIESIEDKMNTVPSYIFDEIAAIVEAKKLANPNLEEVTLSHTEVDDLFSLIDEDERNISQLDELRKLLTVNTL